MSADEFESLVFRLAWADDNRVVRLRAPDGGLDTLLPDDHRPGKADRGWQAKRHTKDIDWRDCEKSLDRAVEFWETRSVTYAFPRDLTGQEHATFHQRLAGRHRDVSVDYWAKSSLDARLATTEGRRIAANVFQEHDAVALAERLLKAGSPLRSAEDFVAAEQAISEGLAELNLDYDWAIHRTTTDSPDVERSPGALLRLSFGRDQVLIHADLVLRHSSAASYPGLSIQLEDSPEGNRARAWLADLMRSGGRLNLAQGVALKLSDIPPPFGEFFGEPVTGEITIRAVAEPAPFYARLVAGAGAERVAIDLDLTPARAPDDWDAMLTGRHGGLTATLRFRWFVEQGRGESRFDFTYQPSHAPHASEALALRWIVAAKSEGNITIEDRTGERPSIALTTSGQPVPDVIRTWAQIHTDLADLEAAAGRSAPQPPNDVSYEDIHRIATVAAMVRGRRHPAGVRDFSITLDPGAPLIPQVGSVLKQVHTQRTLVAIVFETEFPVAHEMIELPPMLVTSSTTQSDGSVRVRAVPLGSDVAEVVAEIVPLSERAA